MFERLFLFLTGNCQKGTPDKGQQGQTSGHVSGLIESYGKDKNEEWLEQTIHAKLFGSQTDHEYRTGSIIW